MISVIVPVYNVEKYLEACIDSILNSTYTDFELILVDDGSTDGTRQICDRFALADQRVCVLHQANAGVSAARNAGLKASKGEYITFVDSDDLVHPRMLEVLWDAISSGDYDMSMALLRKGRANNGLAFVNSRIDELGSREPRLLSQQDYVYGLFTDDNFTGPWIKLFKRTLIFDKEGHFLEFKPIPAEDTEWLVRVAMRMNQIILIPLELYFYLIREESLTHALAERTINPVILGRLQTVYSFLDLFPVDKLHYRSMCLKDLYNRIRLYSFMARGTSYEEETLLQCEKIYKETIKEYLLAPINPVGKMRNVLFYKSPWLYRKFVNLCGLVLKFRSR